MSGRVIPDSVKAGALLDLLRGMSVSAVSSKYDVDRKTVRRWRDEDPEVSRLYSEDIKEDISQLVSDLVKGNLAALQAISTEVSKPEYIQAQRSDQLAALVGTLADKTIRILEAITPDYEEPAEAALDPA